MKISVSIKPKNESERDHLEKTIPDLIKKHTLPIRELLSDSLLRSVHCTRSEDFHKQYKILDDEDHAGLDHLANTYTSIPTFVGLMRHAASAWTLAKLKEKGLIGTAKIKESEPATPPSNIEQISSEPEEESGEQTDESAKTADERVIERLERIDPVAYQFVQEKDIRLISRPKWSWAFEWMRSTFDLEERTDSFGTYFAFLYSPGLSEYQKLTYLIGVIRRDPAFHKWLEAQKIDERGPSGISPAPGTPEYRDYQEQLKEQSYALMAELGATPEEIAARRRGEAANEWLGQQGLLIEVLQAAGAARQVSPSARRGTPGRWAAKPSAGPGRNPGYVPKRLSGRNPPISPRQKLHTDGTAGKSQFKPGIDVEGIVRLAWEAGRPIIDKNGRFIGKKYSFSAPVGTSPSGVDQYHVFVHWSEKSGIHGVPTSRP
ncbi:hypothetical protein K2Y11_11380 [bacterium]|nr:hypothetical protein [bacterium]